MDLPSSQYTNSLRSSNARTVKSSAIVSHQPKAYFCEFDIVTNHNEVKHRSGEQKKSVLRDKVTKLTERNKEITTLHNSENNHPVASGKAHERVVNFGKNTRKESKRSKSSIRDDNSHKKEYSVQFKIDDQNGSLEKEIKSQKIHTPRRNIIKKNEKQHSHTVKSKENESAYAAEMGMVSKIAICKNCSGHIDENSLETTKNIKTIEDISAKTRSNSKYQGKHRHRRSICKYHTKTHKYLTKSESNDNTSDKLVTVYKNLGITDESDSAAVGYNTSRFTSIATIKTKPDENKGLFSFFKSKKNTIENRNSNINNETVNYTKVTQSNHTNVKDKETKKTIPSPNLKKKLSKYKMRIDDKNYIIKNQDLINSKDKNSDNNTKNDGPVIIKNSDRKDERAINNNHVNNIEKENNLIELCNKLPKNNADTVFENAKYGSNEFNDKPKSQNIHTTSNRYSRNMADNQQTVQLNDTIVNRNNDIKVEEDVKLIGFRSKLKKWHHTKRISNKSIKNDSETSQSSEYNDKLSKWKNKFSNTNKHAGNVSDNPQNVKIIDKDINQNNGIKIEENGKSINLYHTRTINIKGCTNDTEMSQSSQCNDKVPKWKNTFSDSNRFTGNVSDSLQNSKTIDKNFDQNGIKIEEDVKKLDLHSKPTKLQCKYSTNNGRNEENDESSEYNKLLTFKNIYSDSDRFANDSESLQTMKVNDKNLNQNYYINIGEDKKKLNNLRSKFIKSTPNTEIYQSSELNKQNISKDDDSLINANMNSIGLCSNLNKWKHTHSAEKSSGNVSNAAECSDLVVTCREVEKVLIKSHDDINKTGTILVDNKLNKEITKSDTIEQNSQRNVNTTNDTNENVKVNRKELSFSNLILTTVSGVYEKVKHSNSESATNIMSMSKSKSFSSISRANITDINPYKSSERIFKLTTKNSHEKCNNIENIHKIENHSSICIIPQDTVKKIENTDSKILENLLNISDMDKKWKHLNKMEHNTNTLNTNETKTSDLLPVAGGSNVTGKLMENNLLFSNEKVLRDVFQTETNILCPTTENKFYQNIQHQIVDKNERIKSPHKKRNNLVQLSSTTIALRDISKVFELEEEIKHCKNDIKNKKLCNADQIVLPELIAAHKLSNTNKQKKTKNYSKFRVVKAESPNERLIEISSKILKNQKISFTVEGIEPIIQLSNKNARIKSTYKPTLAVRIFAGIDLSVEDLKVHSHGRSKSKENFSVIDKSDNINPSFHKSMNGSITYIRRKKYASSVNSKRKHKTSHSSFRHQSGSSKIYDNSAELNNKKYYKKESSTQTAQARKAELRNRSKLVLQSKPIECNTASTQITTNKKHTCKQTYRKNQSLKYVQSFTDSNKCIGDTQHSKGDMEVNLKRASKSESIINDCDIQNERELHSIYFDYPNDSFKSHQFSGDNKQLNHMYRHNPYIDSNVVNVVETLLTKNTPTSPLLHNKHISKIKLSEPDKKCIKKKVLQTASRIPKPSKNLHAVKLKSKTELKLHKNDIPNDDKIKKKRDLEADVFNPEKFNALEKRITDILNKIYDNNDKILTDKSTAVRSISQTNTDTIFAKKESKIDLDSKKNIIKNSDSNKAFKGYVDIYSSSSETSGTIRRRKVIKKYSKKNKDKRKSRPERVRNKDNSLTRDNITCIENVFDNSIGFVSSCSTVQFKLSPRIESIKKQQINSSSTEHYTALDRLNVSKQGCCKKYGVKAIKSNKYGFYKNKKKIADHLKKFIDLKKSSLDVFKQESLSKIVILSICSTCKMSSYCSLHKKIRTISYENKPMYAQENKVPFYINSLSNNSENKAELVTPNSVDSLETNNTYDSKLCCPLTGFFNFSPSPYSYLVYNAEIVTNKNNKATSNSEDKFKDIYTQETDNTIDYYETNAHVTFGANTSFSTITSTENNSIFFHDVKKIPCKQVYQESQETCVIGEGNNGHNVSKNYKMRNTCDHLIINYTTKKSHADYPNTPKIHRSNAFLTCKNISPSEQTINFSESNSTIKTGLKSNESGYETSKTNKTNSIVNFFKKGGSLLEMFKMSYKKRTFRKKGHKDSTRNFQESLSSLATSKEPAFLNSSSNDSIGTDNKSVMWFHTVKPKPEKPLKVFYPKDPKTKKGDTSKTEETKTLFKGKCTCKPIKSGHRITTECQEYAKKVREETALHKDGKIPLHTDITEMEKNREKRPCCANEIDRVAKDLISGENDTLKAIMVDDSLLHTQREKSYSKIVDVLKKPIEDNDPNVLSRESMTDKEVFDKLLVKYEASNSIAKRLSKDEEFFKEQMSDIHSISSAIDLETESTFQIIDSKTRKLEVSKVRGPRFTDKALPTTMKVDCQVEADDIGTCFARGFRPDNLMLSGDACFHLNKQDKIKMSPYMLKNTESIIDFSERETPLDFLLALGFMVDEASNALKDEDIRSRLLAGITEARVWINKITTTQGTLLYLVAYKARPEIMRYFLQLVEAIINKRITNAIMLDGFLRVLEQVEDGRLQMVNILGEDKFEDEENEEKIVKKQLKDLFVNVYSIAEEENRAQGKVVSASQTSLLRILVSKYRAGLQPHLELIARYIGQGLLSTEIQLEAAMIFLSRLDTAEVKLKEFENYCGIRCEMNKQT